MLIFQCVTILAHVQFKMCITIVYLCYPNQGLLLIYACSRNIKFSKRIIAGDYMLKKESHERYVVEPYIHAL